MIPFKSFKTAVLALGITCLLCASPALSFAKGHSKSASRALAKRMQVPASQLRAFTKDLLDSNNNREATKNAWNPIFEQAIKDESFARVLGSYVVLHNLAGSLRIKPIWLNVQEIGQHWSADQKSRLTTLLRLVTDIASETKRLDVTGPMLESIVLDWPEHKGISFSQWMDHTQTLHFQSIQSGSESPSSLLTQAAVELNIKRQRKEIQNAPQDSASARGPASIRKTSSNKAKPPLPTPTLKLKKSG